MTSDSPPPGVREAALRAFELRGRRHPVAQLLEEKEIPGGSGLLWRFACDDVHFDVELVAVGEGWLTTVRVTGRSSFAVTVFRDESAAGRFIALDGEASVGVLAPGPLSLDIKLDEKKEVQSNWLSLPRLRGPENA